MPKGVYIRKPCSEEAKENMRQVMLGKKHSEEAKENMRQAQLKNHQEHPERKEKQRQAILGKKHTEEAIEKMRQVILKRKQELGYINSPEAIEKVRQAHLGKKRTPETCEKIRQKSLGRHWKWSQETKEKMRKARIKQIEQNYGIAKPSYNLSASEYFKSFDIEHNTHGRYAVYGDGEYQVCGYFLDYINFDMKLIIEWDEEHHFDENGNLLEKDIQRQKEIQEHFPDFEFRRIKE